MNRKWLSLLVAVLWPACCCFSQPYLYSESSSTYSNLTGATSINGGAVWSSFQSFNVPIGFSFQYMGNTYTSINIEGSGFTFFDLNYYFLLSPFTAKLKDKGTSSSASPLSYRLDGSQPNRILKIEWNNCGFQLDAASTANFQLWLYETSNIIESRTGPCTVVNAASAYNGNKFQGPVIGLFKYSSSTNCLYGHTVMGNAVNPNDSVFAGTANIFDYSMTGTPASGKVYRFDPLSSGIGDNKALSKEMEWQQEGKRIRACLAGAAVDGKATLRIFDLLGNQVFADGNYALCSPVELPGLCPGIYIAELLHDNCISRKKFPIH